MSDTTKQVDKPIDLLQMTTTELSRFIEVSLFENPILVRIDAQRAFDDGLMPKAVQDAHSTDDQTTTKNLPELYIQEVGDDDYEVGFVDDAIPLLRIDQRYKKMLNDPETSSELREAIKQKMRSAVDLLRNLDHRRTLSYEIAHAIVRHQHEFLEKGVKHIKPMTLKDAAKDTGISALFISHVVNGKYAQTPHGVIELRRFFTGEEIPEL